MCSYYSRLSLVVLALSAPIHAATLTFDWDITWVEAAPDGFTRAVIGVNGVWPCPPIVANVGDVIVVKSNNQLGNQTTSLHWHGLSMNGTQDMDGPAWATQCPIPSGQSMTYTFNADAPGTYWWHSHVSAQYPDGLRAALIIHGADPYAGDYSSEVLLTVSDWYHKQGAVIAAELQAPQATFPDTPVPQSVLINDTTSVDITVEEGSVYKVRLINMAASTAMMVQFDQHSMEVVEVDGVDVHDKVVQQIRIAPAQRYAFLLRANANATAGQKFPFIVAADLNDDWTVSATWALNATGYIIYGTPSTSSNPTFTVDEWAPLDDTTLNPVHDEAIYASPGNTVVWDVTAGLNASSIPHAYFNGSTYIHPSIPTLYTVVQNSAVNKRSDLALFHMDWTDSVATSANPVTTSMNLGSTQADVASYGQINQFNASQGQVLDIVVNNLTPTIHPFHLHGHQFQVIDRPPANTGSYSGVRISTDVTPLRRDTVEIMSESYVVIRVIANNPGVWLFHCHNEWHVVLGLTSTLIEAANVVQATVSIPQDQLNICSAQGVSVSGLSRSAHGKQRKRW